MPTCRLRLNAATLGQLTKNVSLEITQSHYIFIHSFHCFENKFSLLLKWYSSLSKQPLEILVQKHNLFPMRNSFRFLISVLKVSVGILKQYRKRWLQQCVLWTVRESMKVRHISFIFVPRYPVQHLTQSKYSIKVCRMNKWWRLSFLASSGRCQKNQDIMCMLLRETDLFGIQWWLRLDF